MTTQVSNTLNFDKVLILIVMEYSIWSIQDNKQFKKYDVLILIIMEYSIWYL